ncbi:MAG: ABC transporter permease [Candidatus Omnitrophota bacterium]|nr:ABC transporter permease [Candidatus Omnitrophota bacterium]
MIQTSNLRKVYRMGEVEVQALQDVSLTVEQGDFVAIMGPSGSGKSTLMHVLGLLDVPDAGSYRLSGREIRGLSEDELAALRARTIGFVFQQFNLLPRMSALENTRLPLLYAPGLHNGSAPSRPLELLEQVGLKARMGHTPAQLSGGQQQRVAIARALVNRPRVIFADEPTGNLDSASSHEILEILSGLNRQGITVILVTHEQEVADRARRIIRMRDGRIESDTSNAVPFPNVPGSGEQPGTAGNGTGFFLREISDHFRQAVRALLANKVRTGLSTLGILIGVAAVIAMLALGSGASASIEARLASLGSNLLMLRPGARQAGRVALESGVVTRMTLADAEAVAALPGIRRVAPSVDGRGQVVYGNRNWNTRIEGVTPDYASVRGATPVAGRFFDAEESRRRSRVVLVGQTVSRELFGDANPVGETIKINRSSFQVIGVLPAKGATGWRDQDDVVVVPIGTAMRRLLGKEHVDDISIEVEEAEGMSAVEDSVQDLMRRRHRIPASRKGAFEIRNMAEIQAALSETNRTMTLLLASIAVISLLVGGIGIMNIMLVSVTERTREIGLRKAIGARRRDILGQFLVEAVVVSVAGGVIGIALGWLITLGMSQWAGWAAQVSLSAVALSFFFSCAVGVLFGFWPARKAAALNPIEALRYE